MTPRPRAPRERRIVCAHCDAQRTEPWPPPSGVTRCPGCGTENPAEHVEAARGQGSHPTVWISPAPWDLELQRENERRLDP